MQKYKVRELQAEDNARLEQVIRTCLVEIGQDHEGTIWTLHLDLQSKTILSAI